MEKSLRVFGSIMGLILVCLICSAGSALAANTSLSLEPSQQKRYDLHLQASAELLSEEPQKAAQRAPNSIKNEKLKTQPLSVDIAKKELGLEDSRTSKKGTTDEDSN